MACPTRADGYHFGLISSEQCSGQGICVNASSISSQFSGLCLCNEFYTGESDMFDLRVAKLPSGEWLSLDCPNPRNGVITVFSMQLIVLFARFILLIAALIAQCRFKGRMTLRKMYAYTPYKVLILDTLIASPILISLPIQKLLPQGFVIGTDAGPTVSLVLGTFLASAAYNDFEFSQFASIVKASSMNHEHHARLLRRQRLFIQVIRGSYCVFALIPSFAALGLDKSLGPIKNGEFITLILRNVGITIWLFTQWLSDTAIQEEIRQLSSSLVQTNRGDTSGSLNVLRYLNKHARTTKVTALVGCLIWTFFSLPWFWPFQGYAMTIVTCITCARTANEGTVLLKSARIVKQSDKTNTNSGPVADPANSQSSSKVRQDGKQIYDDLVKKEGLLNEEGCEPIDGGIFAERAESFTSDKKTGIMSKQISGSITPHFPDSPKNSSKNPNFG